jgi:hypothetical protein
MDAVAARLARRGKAGVFAVWPNDHGNRIIRIFRIIRIVRINSDGQG